ncbi:hypothetical protein DSCO28_66970 [Desulfosarcina ovata subsp. sediminis]|uniref:Uncharacterized protein n=1 Tax=Desulfosarcina ovata subsp. sediminis TaxID=885957 RepID=A0A5K8A143_9BACT|nr:hypothetical protein [Desulfosarcina ovata]BBO86131.1 hypothetical protein DSCO28_66970 [Desulfosarcina ovata subsp. sediminis]
MGDSNDSVKLSGYNKITSPIPLLAFLGVIVEAVIGTLGFRLQTSPLQPYLVAAAVILPIFLIIVIYLLLTRHHFKLYSPKDYSDPNHFLQAMKQSQKEIEKVGFLNVQDKFTPFYLSEEAEKNQLQLLKHRVSFWERYFFQNAKPPEFIALHSFYYETCRHDLALICIDIAIAGGMITSKNYSYRSASLRNLGRLIESQFSALTALCLDDTNIDAHYNLSKTYNLMGLKDKALCHAELCFKNGDGPYDHKLLIVFPQLLDSDKNKQNKGQV